MKFIITNLTTDESQLVSRECAYRVKGRFCIDSLIKKVEETGEPVEVYFEDNYDLKVTNR